MKAPINKEKNTYNPKYTTFGRKGIPLQNIKPATLKQIRDAFKIKGDK